MGLYGQHIAKFGDWIDLETLGVAHDNRFKPLAGAKMDRGGMAQIGFDRIDLVLVIGGGANTDIEWASRGCRCWVGGTGKTSGERRGYEGQFFQGISSPGSLRRPGRRSRQIQAD